LSNGLKNSVHWTGDGPLRPVRVKFIPKCGSCFQPFEIVEEVKTDLYLIEN